jgi:signal transduction histidine kinase
VTNTSLERGAVDLGEQASSIVAELYGAGPKRDVEVIIPRGLVAHGDARLLRIALENLLGNAWKYTAKRARPRIELGVLGLPDEPIYFVRDNGAGFDMEHATRLFRPFERLHSSREFPGSGLGLATVRQIIERHGGRVWAESRVDQGATFYFVL